jgi:hypothetical protein
LTYTWNWELAGAPVENGNYKLSVTFGSENEGSKLAITASSDNKQQQKPVNRLI